jgi:hypothetical protein
VGDVAGAAPPRELRLAGCTTLEAANAFLTETWVPFHNRTWTVPAAGERTAFVPYTGGQLDRICAVHHERVVGHDTCAVDSPAGRAERPLSHQSGVRASTVRSHPPCSERQQGYPNNRTS